jgi:hypothetical protein
MPNYERILFIFSFKIILNKYRRQILKEMNEGAEFPEYYYSTSCLTIYLTRQKI